MPGIAGSVAVAAGKTVAGGAIVATVAASSFGQIKQRCPVGSIRGQLSGQFSGQRNPAQPASISTQAIASGTKKRRQVGERRNMWGVGRAAPARTDRRRKERAATVRAGARLVKCSA